MDYANFFRVPESYVRLKRMFRAINIPLDEKNFKKIHLVIYTCENRTKSE